MPEQDLADLLRTLDDEPRRRGREFEAICCWYLLNDPVYRAQLREVWLWDDWTGRWGADAGIDLVAQTHDGHLWAIQAKAYDPAYAIKKADVDTFLSESARPEFAYRLLIATTDKLARNAERAMRAQEKPVGELLLHDLERAEVRWPASVEDLRPARPEPKTPRPHQQEAIEAVLKGLEDADRGQLIMACGTGKTLVSLWINEALDAERTLVLVPSLSLLKQTIREWLINANREFEFLPVCSDETVGDHDEMVAAVAELGFPATGDAEEIRAFLARSGPRVVFSTYQSSPVVAAALESSGQSFDLALADEAHRCAGPVSSDFATILDAEQIPATKRLFMTATPRYFTGKVRKAGIDADFEIASMDDDERFGEVLHRLTFGEAIERDLLSDYRVLVIGVDDEMYRDYAERGAFVTLDGEEVTDARKLAAQIGLAAATKKYDLRRTITFHGRVKAAKAFAESLPAVIDWLPEDKRPLGDLWAEHVSGAMNTSQREAHLRHLRALDAGQRGILANAKCLSEGVDVPTLDGVAFIDPRRSEVDIAQAVGRAIRKAENKQLGTVVIPVFVSPGDDPEQAVEASAFKPVWDVIRALRDHDEQLGDALDEIRRELEPRPGSERRQLPPRIVLDLPERVSQEFARAFETRLVESTTASWEYWFGLLLRWVEREGHARVPHDRVEGASAIGSWVLTQRQARKGDRLAPERVRRLEALPGWAWDPRTQRWEDGFAHLERFVEREGHARVPKDHVEGELRLGKWVGTQRGARNAGRLEPERVQRLEALPGWVWDPLGEGWGDAFDRLEDFVAREGHARVPRDHVEGDLRLDVWVGHQRSRWKAGRLEPEHLQRLEEVPGWTWDARIQKWEDGYAHLEDFVAREGHARVPRDHVEGDLRLGVWVGTQRRSEKIGRLSPERARRLKALPGWTADPHAAAWEEGFAHLTRFVERERHARVPSSQVEDGFRLGFWVANQRQAWKKRELEPERVERLEALPGWAWDSRAQAWEEGFACLEGFVAREGHVRVPQSHVEGDFRLGSWIGTLRAAWKAGRLEPERVERLEALQGWAWDSRAQAWEEGFAHLARFVEREGHARVRDAHVEGEFSLGTWVGSQRRSWKKRRLEPERLQRLEALPGWEWSATRRKNIRRR